MRCRTRCPWSTYEPMLLKGPRTEKQPIFQLEIVEVANRELIRSR